MRIHGALALLAVCSAASGAACGHIGAPADAPPPRRSPEPAVDASSIPATPVAPAPPGPVERAWAVPASGRGWPSAGALAPTRTLRPSGHASGLLAFNDIVVVHDADGIWSCSLASPDTPPAHDASELRNVGPELASGLVLGMLSGELVALDARTLARRWQTRLVTEEDARRWDGTRLQGVLAGPGRLVARLRTQDTMSWELVAIDPSSGVIAWRARLAEETMDHPDAIAEDRVLSREGTALVARELSTGRRAWAVDLPRAVPDASGAQAEATGVEHEAYLVASGDRAVAEISFRAGDASGSGARAEVAFIDAARGRVLRRETLTDDHRHAMILEGHDLVRAREVKRGETLAYEDVDVDTGRVVWRTPALRGWVQNLDPFVVDADVVFARDSFGGVYALDRATGAVRWSWGFEPFDSAIAIARPREGAPGVLVVDATLFERGPRPVPAVQVTVSGVVTFAGAPVSGALVQVNGVHATTDAAGRYRVSIAGNGEVEVVASDPRTVRAGDGDRVHPAAHAWVELKQAGEVTVPLTLQRPCGEACY